ncbi:hypothetical protein [Ponticoccus alexandrii]|uniref:Uncharacterized protein n=1 Tax=Ponticoccus alexandrii TaxID=1943633 RepID=A0ABX7FE40_9RHOB|nr:hypothetical protein [Ponticoccus alexandrii]QRF68146.1 hypothetical protein GQA70_18620 [Ponticoccus alexandrii]
MYKNSFVTIARALPVLAPLVLLAAAAEYIEPRVPRALMSFVLYALMALFAHRASLLKERPTVRQALSGRAADGAPLPVLAFLLRAAVFIGALVALIFGLGYGLALYSGVEERLLRAVVVGGILLGIVLHGILLSYTGTMLPACAVGDDASLAAAWARGKQTFGRTLGRLFFGSFLFSAFTVILFVVIEGTLGEATGLRLAAERLLGAAMALVSTVLAAMALGRAYEDASA